jgi:hypothetical protein
VLCILLVAEVLASTGSVCETGLVYIARIRNLVISIAVLLLQIGLSFGFIIFAKESGWGAQYQAAGPAIALAVSLTIGSAIKAWLLQRLTGAPGVSFRRDRHFQPGRGSLYLLATCL